MTYLSTEKYCHRTRQKTEVYVITTHKPDISNPNDFYPVLIQRQECYEFDPTSSQISYANIKLYYELTTETYGTKKYFSGEYYFLPDDKSYVSIAETALFLDLPNMRGMHVGTHLMNEIVVWAKQWPTATVGTIQLLSSQATDDNKNRRNKFFEQFGLRFIFDDENKCEGTSIPMIASQLTPVNTWQKTLKKESVQEFMANEKASLEARIKALDNANRDMANHPFARAFLHTKQLAKNTFHLNLPEKQEFIHTFSDFPDAVIEPHAWPWWRIVLKRPSEYIQKRCNAWQKLLRIKENPEGFSEKSAYITPPKSKIFGNSCCRWDSFGTKESFDSPHGPLVKSTIVDRFECDATDIEGISESKSQFMQHDSIDTFGAYYIDEQNRYSRKENPPLKLDDASLRELCSHDEIRLLHGGTYDTFSIRAWDGRLFIDNSGGSHHLAGAAYIAKRIGEPIPLASKLYLYQFNHLTVEWLLNGFYLVLLPGNLMSQAQWAIKDLVGASSCMKLPGIFGNGALLSFPKGLEIADCAMDELMEQGHLNFGNLLKEAFLVEQKFLSSISPWVKYFQPTFDPI